MKNGEKKWQNTKMRRLQRACNTLFRSYTNRYILYGRSYQENAFLNTGIAQHNYRIPFLLLIRSNQFLYTICNSSDDITKDVQTIIPNERKQIVLKSLLLYIYIYISPYFTLIIYIYIFYIFYLIPPHCNHEITFSNNINLIKKFSYMK